MVPIFPPPPPKNRRLDDDLYTRVGVYTFITIRADQKQKSFVQPTLAAMVVALLQEEASRQGCHIHAYCLMPDHLHYLISPDQEAVSVLRFTDQFKGKTTNRSWTLGWHGRLWQPRSYDHILREEEDWMQVAEYIVMNPVRKGWVSEWTDWPWSGIFE